MKKLRGRWGEVGTWSGKLCMHADAARSSVLKRAVIKFGTRQHWEQQYVRAKRGPVSADQSRHA